MLCLPSLSGEALHDPQTLNPLSISARYDSVDEDWKSSDVYEVRGQVAVHRCTNSVQYMVVSGFEFSRKTEPCMDPGIGNCSATKGLGLRFRGKARNSKA